MSVTIMDILVTTGTNNFVHMWFSTWILWSDEDKIKVFGHKEQLKL